MKRSSSILLATLLVALIGRPGMAQSLSVGPKAGIGFANGGGDVEDTNSNFGFNIGGVFGIQLNDYFRLEMNGQYVQKGFWQDVIAEIDGGTVDAKASTNVNYLEFMVPATLTIPIRGSRIEPRLFAGPALAIEVSCVLSVEVMQYETNVDCGDAEVETKSIDFSVFFGGGVELALGSGAITLDLLYDLGLTNVNDVTGSTASLKNRNFQIVTGYRFFFGG
jgi:hypothetical protein